MEAYFWAFVNFEQNNWVRFLLMVEFAYNNTKNASISYTFFKLNYGYYLYISYKKDLNPHSKLKTAKKLSSKLQNLMAVCQQNVYYAQKLQKQAYNKGVKPQSYALGNKIWLSSKYLKTKQNCKLKAKFLGFFWVLHSVGK